MGVLTEPLLEGEAATDHARETTPSMHRCSLGACCCLPKVAVARSCADGSTRNMLWDNYKGIGQIFVLSMHASGGVIILGGGWSTFFFSEPGHLWNGYTTFISFITMPGYCFITGMFSTDKPNRKQLVNQFRYVVAFFIAHFVLMFFNLHAVHKQDVINWSANHPFLNHTNAALKAEGKEPLQPPGWMPVAFFQTVGVDWYLWCVVLWRLLLPVLSLLRRPLLASVVLAMAMMFTDTSCSVYSNAPFLFMPFFVLGFTFRRSCGGESKLKQWKAMPVLKAAFLTICVVFTAAPMFEGDSFWYSRATSYAIGCLYGGEGINWIDPHKLVHEGLKDMPLPRSTMCQTSQGVAHVLGFYAMSSFLILSFATVLPDRRVWLLTKAGTNSIYIYLTHIYLFIMPLNIVCKIVVANYTIPTAAIVPIVFMSVVVFWGCLAQGWVKSVFFSCVEPPVEMCCVLSREV